jgi:hypothetical protein
VGKRGARHPSLECFQGGPCTVDVIQGRQSLPKSIESPPKFDMLVIAQRPRSRTRSKKESDSNIHDQYPYWLSRRGEDAFEIVLNGKVKLKSSFARSTPKKKKSIKCASDRKFSQLVKERKDGWGNLKGPENPSIIINCKLST